MLLQLELKRTDNFIYLLGLKYKLITSISQNNNIKINQDLKIVYFNFKSSIDTNLKLKKLFYKLMILYFEDTIVSRIKKYKDKFFDIFKDKSIFDLKLKVKLSKTYFGVYYKNKSIYINIILLHFPINNLDYVIVHELCHHYHFNHSSDFWNVVSLIIPSYKTSYRALREFNFNKIKFEIK